MDENLQNIEDLFRTALNDEEEIPSPNIWEAVNKKLDKDTIVSIKRKYTTLKKVAILLVLLLLSFTLYEVNFIYKSKEYTKNNIDKKNKDIINAKTDEALIKNNRSNIVAGVDTAPTNITPIQKITLNKIVADANKDLNNHQNTVTENNVVFQKQTSIKITTTAKDIFDTHTTAGITSKKKINTGLACYIKIKNAKISEDEQLLVQNNAKDYLRSSLKNVNTVLFETLQMRSKDFINSKKITPLIITQKVNLSDSSSKIFIKILPKNFRKISRFSITPFIAPDIAWYRLEDDKIGNQIDDAKEIEKDEKHEFSSTVGVLIDYKINKYWGLQSGLSFSNTSITVQPKTIYAQQDNIGSVKYRINTSSGYGYVLPSYISNPSIGDSLYAFTSTHSLQYIGIPLAITYAITKGKFKFNAVAGAAANILATAKLKTTVENGLANSTETVNNLLGVKNMYLSGLASVGIDYSLTNKIALTFMPTIRFALSSINKDATVKSYPTSLGFAVGLKITL